MARPCFRTITARIGGKVGWYGYRPGEFFPTGALGNLSETTIELYLWSHDASDAKRILPNPPDRRSVQGWIEFLQGRRPNYPVEAMQQERQETAKIAQRTVKTASGYGPSPVAFESLANLTLGAANLYGSGDVLRSQVRFFDPARRRAGLAQDVAALVEKIERDSVTLTLVNVSPTASRRLIVQMGAYGEHQASSVRVGDRNIKVDESHFDVQLAPGAGETLVIGHQTPGKRSDAGVSVGSTPMSRGSQCSPMRRSDRRRCGNRPVDPSGTERTRHLDQQADARARLGIGRTEATRPQR